MSEKGKYLGTGFVSRESKIRLRLLSRNANDRFDEAFWRRRVQYAWDYRKTVLRPEDLGCCRVIFGEADGFPGLTVDRFSDLLVTQTLSVGIERIKELLFPLLLEVLRADGQAISGVYERNDAAIRALEGLVQYKGWWGEEHPLSPVTEICENGVFYAVDVENGQKTGFFLDQKYNRLAVARLAEGKRVLDCFTHTGSFALNAAKGGAEHVTAADVSEAAVEMARRNALRNGLEGKMDFLCADIFDLLPELEAKGGTPYDFIILDPPAFTKSRKTVKGAERGYKEINCRAMKLLPRGGYLATASCSHFMHAGSPVREDAARGRARRGRGAAADRDAPAGAGPSDPVERARNGLSEILSLPAGVRPGEKKTDCVFRSPSFFVGTHFARYVLTSSCSSSSRSMRVISVRALL